MDRKSLLAAAAALSIGAALSPGGFGLPEPVQPRQHHRKAKPDIAGRSKKKFKGSKAAKRAARRHA